MICRQISSYNNYTRKYNTYNEIYNMYYIHIVYRIKSFGVPTLCAYMANHSGFLIVLIARTIGSFHYHRNNPGHLHEDDKQQDNKTDCYSEFVECFGSANGCSSIFMVAILIRCTGLEGGRERERAGRGERGRKISRKERSKEVREVRK